MNDLWIITCGAGLRDGLNPCIFITCAVFICFSLFVIPASTHVIPAKAGIHNFSGITFALVYVPSTLIFNFGPVQIFLFHKNFILAAKIIYFVLGFGSFILGILFFKDWFNSRRALPSSKHCHSHESGNPFTDQGIIIFLTTIITAVILSALSTLWPINNYIMLLGNEGILRGQWQMVVPLLTGYVIISMWPLWFVWAFLSIKNLRPSMLKIICAAIFFTASSSMILIFK